LGHDGGAASVCVNAEDPAAALQALGGAGVILATVTSGKPTAALIAGLRARGRMVVVGASPDPIEVPPAPLLFGTRAVEGALAGPPLASEDTLAFSVLAGFPRNRNRAARRRCRGIRQDDAERGPIPDGPGHGPLNTSGKINGCQFIIETGIFNYELTPFNTIELCLN
jgi:hypothetical protein